MSNNIVIIIISSIIILSFFFNMISRKTQIPSVILLIGAGFAVRISPWFPQVEKVVDIFLTLNILGIIGLIMIVLEAAVDLKLSRDRLPIILRALGVAALLLFITSGAIGFIIHKSAGIEFKNALLYALPLSVMSSAIIIPSVESLSRNKREFMIYEGTFSDILGIIVFYMLIEWFEQPQLTDVILQTAGKLSVTIIFSIGITLALTFLFQRMFNEINYFLIFAILLLLYAIGKEFHLSALILILVFGVMINNKAVFFNRFFGRFIENETYDTILQNLKLFIKDTAFLIRTFFFFFFGLLISPEAFADMSTYYVVGIILLALYLIRYFSLKIFINTKIFPELFIAPRGLITILLLFSIPAHLVTDQFQEDITFMVIIATNLIMMFALLGQKKNAEEEVEEEVPLEVETPDRLKEEGSNSEEQIE